MYTTGIRDLRSDLAAALRRAERGESTVINDRGRPIARLGPIDDHAPTLTQLIHSGALTSPRRLGEWQAGEPIRVWSGARIDLALRDLRG